MAAPAGYGKTTVVAQWLHAGTPPTTAWVSLDPGDNDPDRLWTHVAAALERAGCPLPIDELSRVLGHRSAGAPSAVLPAIVNALAAMPDDLVLVLDDFQSVQSPACHEQVEFLIRNLPVQAHLVIVTRSDPGLRLGRLRVSHDLAELRAEDLAFTAPEAAQMLADQGVHLSEDTLAQLMERTEGWPAALYLATLSLAGRAEPDDFVRRFTGDNRFIGDYLTEEVLSRQPDRIRDFITALSILERFSAPLCDHVAGVSDSAVLLHELERTNLFLIPLGVDGEWFRFHHIFAAVARSELTFTHPERVQPFHALAAEWFAANGHISEAVQHSLAAGRADDAALLIHANWLEYADAGRAATVIGWLESLGEISGSTVPAARATAAWMAALVGDEPALAEHLAALDSVVDDGPLPDGTRSIESTTALIRGLFGYGGPLDILASAQRALELETDDHSRFHAIAQCSLGHAHYVLGDLDQAITAIRAAARSASAPGIVRVLALSLQSFIESERGDRVRSRECAELAMAVVDARGLRSSPQASLAFAALGQAQAAAGKVDDARTTLELGLSLRRQSNAQGVWGPIHHLLITARVAAQLGASSLAYELLPELAERMSRFSEGMAAMRSREDAIHHLLSDQTTVDVLGEPLTGRELDVLRLLQGSLSLQEIASHLFLSANTVKTHARAVYRKLGAHSRTEAVQIARRQSLI
ncbi:LuxR C-terminal-related transcriptional regulator [Nocardioides sp. HM23]|uniref:helix-turn-helix transcriptional regulator n=1 Tax=Nocardioides bizhenqiangii TaxID=3095076 RepID=UPI002AC9F6D9|nr:LuxR C-terminal-related transcriptional regulator [Nocardioides sp. HM23]MDZ5623054.1 LuxR C-terminal-related transcriptional regulator [Nocardioides sp. HM23]